MKVVILGGGVVGVCTAYFLAADGAEVTLIERNDGLARETSAVNAGLISPGHTFTWASPRAPKTLIRSLMGKETALRMHWRPDLELYRWGIHFFANCTTDRARVNTLRRLRLAQYSKSILDSLTDELDLRFHKRDRGALFLYRTQRAMDAGVARLALLKEHGEPQEVLDADQIVSREPAFAPIREKLVGAVYSPSTSSGDSSMFAEQLALRCRALGVEFLLSTRAEKFEIERGAITGVRTDKGIVASDKYILTMGCCSRGFAKTAGLSLPIYPVKGYTLTAPISDDAIAPTLSGIDEDRLVAWSRFGDNLRMTGTADFNGYRTTINDTDARAIYQSAGELFPHSIRWEQREMRVGLRPVTPDEVPLLGPSRRYPDLLLNTGHGNLGWVMSAGSSKLVADLALGRRPALDPRTLDVTISE